MSLRRNGDWTLIKVEEGKYQVQEAGVQRATIITDEHSQSPNLNVGLDTYEVEDFSEVEEKFEELSTRGGLL